ncbi:MAG: hypothetical protein AAF418_07160 [Pseudomonadota bacterium]
MTHPAWLVHETGPGSVDKEGIEALRALVIGLAVLIMLALGALIWGFATRAGKLADAGGHDVGEAIGQKRFTLPEGSQISTSEIHDEWLIIRWQKRSSGEPDAGLPGAGLPVGVLVIDLDDGTVHLDARFEAER